MTFLELVGLAFITGAMAVTAAAMAYLLTKFFKWVYFVLEGVFRRPIKDLFRKRKTKIVGCDCLQIEHREGCPRLEAWDMGEQVPCTCDFQERLEEL